MGVIRIITLLTAACFLYYGYTSLFNRKVKEEYRRFRVDSHRELTGVLQLLGAIGLLIGEWIPALRVLAAAGLSLLMLLGFSVRIREGDSLKGSLPSFFFMLLNAYLSYHFYQLICEMMNS